MHFCWTLDISQTASFEITRVRLSARPSLSFLKIGWLVFSHIVHDDSWPWYLVTNEARLFKKNLAGLKQARNEVFRHFIEFWSYVVLDHSLWRCLTSSRSKTHEKKLGAQIWVNQAQNE